MRYILMVSALWATLVQAQTHQHPSPPVPESGGRPSMQAKGERSAAGREWTRHPLLLPGMGRGGDRNAVFLRPVGIEAAGAQVFAADGPADRRHVDYPAGPEGIRIESAAPKVGNYHWVVARQESADMVRVASTAWYFGNPGASPADLLPQVRHELEIIPTPLPREHGAYRESEKWRFLVRLNGVPLAGQPVTLETEFGSRSSFVTDAGGYATVLFPRDFRSIAAQGGGHEGHGPRRAKFVLATEKEDGGRRFLTAFNHHYGQDADRDRNLGWGLLFGVAGMIAATPLLRRRESGAEGERNA